MLVWLGMVACGEASSVSAQACPAGVATRVKRVHPPGSDTYGRVEHLTDVQGTLFFSTDSVSSAPVLWRSDGTEAGTTQVRVFPSGDDSFLGGFAAVGPTLYFFHHAPEAGLELWASDGTGRGTRRVKPLTLAEGVDVGMATEVDGRLLFVLDVMMRPPQLWSSDGTAAGTVKLLDLEGALGLAYARTLKVAKGWLFFRLEAGGTTLWRSDGTAVGTRLVARLDQGETWVEQVAGAGDLGLFVLRDGPNAEVWKTDGTTEGTVRLDTFGTQARVLGVLGGQVSLGVSTEEGTVRLVRLSLAGGGRTYVATLPNPGLDLVADVQRSTVSGGQLYFSVAYGGPSPVPLDAKLWVTDGTAAGTRALFGPLLRDEERGSPVFATGGGPVLFVAGNDTRLWSTQGAPSTTGRVVSLSPEAPVFPAEAFTRAGSRVYFSAVDETGLRQLWSVPASFSCPPGARGAR
ncbi:hypothetical protein LZ198_37010 [Myxococcus sp. K15C18031901]|uniref:hypothetical protein n=1 Tax=Myxococcus dinghuensis TaxID=2906761 RepID=UPI0020A6FC25|nr:hypothetical protein [Myxococcus dinghuensis]MCP3104478.1 hypothetical protein [Myxococcus dinghuensis]